MTDWKFIFEKWIMRKHRPGYTEKKVEKALRKIKGDVFVDVGANVGYYSILLRPNFRKVYAFEPNVDLLNSWEADVTKIPCALSNFDGEADFYLGTGIGSADTLLPAFKYRPGVQTGFKNVPLEKSIRIPVRTYDSFFAHESSFEKVDLVKIDVEGAELLVLQGMEGSLSRHLIRNIMIEIHDIEEEPSITKYLKSFGFSIIRIDSHPHLLAVRQAR